jgi:pimeloyl-ACP methyl ester carboxylesterase
VPTLLIAGDQDSAVMSAMQFLRRSIPGAGLKVYPWSGHTVNMEECDSFNLDVRNFFDDIGSQQGAI